MFPAVLTSRDQSKDKEKLQNYAKITNYAILTRQVKVQYEKKPILNLKIMQIVGFEQLQNLLRFSLCNNFLTGKKLWWKPSKWLSMIVVMCFVLTYI